MPCAAAACTKVAIEKNLSNDRAGSTRLPRRNLSPEEIELQRRKRALLKGMHGTLSPWPAVCARDLPKKNSISDQVAPDGSRPCPETHRAASAPSVSRRRLRAQR